MDEIERLRADFDAYKLDQERRDSTYKLAIEQRLSAMAIQDRDILQKALESIPAEFAQRQRLENSNAEVSWLRIAGYAGIGAVLVAIVEPFILHAFHI